MYIQAHETAGQPGQAAAQRMLELVPRLHAAGLSPLRTAIEPGGFSFLICDQPERWLEVRVDEDGIAVAYARSPSYGEPVMLSIEADHVISGNASLRQLRLFVDTGKF